MAVRALPPGRPRRRAAFGLLDADGWTWALIKGTFWFVVVIFLLGYVPDRAYYFTVFPTIDIGANVISPINLCPPTNKNLGCPAPPGAIVPWEPSPNELALPAARAGAATVQSGTNVYLIGGSVDGTATDSVLTTLATASGNLAPWAEASPLPEGRSDATVLSFGGVPYVIGGLGPDGAPTATVFRGTTEEGALTGWEEVPELELPEPLADAAGAATGTAMWLFGGSGPNGPSQAVYRAVTAESGDAFEAWEALAHIPLPEARSGAGAANVGDFLYVVGGEHAGGVATELFRLGLDSEGEPAGEGDAVEGWAITRGAAAGQSLPQPRVDASVFSANQGIYVVGGRDASGAVVGSTFWAIPNATTGDIGEWSASAETDLPEGRADAAAAVAGSFAFLVGGEGPSGPVTNSLRSNLAPLPPFFRLGLFGVTVPALNIEGEIGQQLGYLNAAGVGTINFILLILIAVAFSHRQRSLEILERITRGRYRAPRESEYFD
jgi:N-acetylneuraminic acid mutarotase